MKPSPCPICHLEGGFHDNDDEWSDFHRRTLDQIPPQKIRPTATDKNTKKREEKHQNYLRYLASRGEQ